MHPSGETNQGSESACERIHGSGGSKEENILRVLGANCQGFQPRGFRQVEHDIHILDCLPGPSLHEVVNATNDYEPACSQIGSSIDKAEVSPPDVLGMGGLGRYSHKGSMLVEVPVYTFQGASCEPAAIGQFSVACGQYTSGHGHQMRHKGY